MFLWRTEELLYMRRHKEQCNKVLKIRNFEEEASVKYKSNSIETITQSIYLELLEKVDLKLLEK